MRPRRASGHWSRSFASCGRIVVTYDPNSPHGHLTTCTLTVTTPPRRSSVGSVPQITPATVDGAEVLLDGLGSERAHFGRASPGPPSATNGCCRGPTDCIRVLRRYRRRRRRPTSASRQSCGTGCPCRKLSSARPAGPPLPSGTTWHCPSWPMSITCSPAASAGA